ncbi:L-threonine ammonia-lyase [Carnimonas sp. R-84981]|uniref:hydroxyectoine utilization dehydratase EutB n=1 Tax=Carnimonas bestiolae TaxID=3402172 RepID=UPI003EDC4AE7
MSSTSSLHDIFLAARHIKDLALRTPLVPSISLSRRFDAEVLLKLENLQPTGAFKLRGVLNWMTAHAQTTLEKGVTTASTGNHGRAVAWAAQRMGTHATICLSSLVPPNKVAAIENMGAKVKICGHSQDDAFIEAQRLAHDDGMQLIPPFDDPYVIAGQGTIGLELMEDAPDLDHVFIGLSGGGLLGGIGSAIKAINPHCRITGVSPLEGAAMIASLEAGRPVEVTEGATLADSLGGGIGMDNRHTLRLVHSVMDDYCQVSENAIGSAMLALFKDDKMLVEGAAAVGAAALEEHAFDIQGKRVALVISGNNVDPAVITRLYAATNH